MKKNLLLLMLISLFVATTAQCAPQWLGNNKKTYLAASAGGLTALSLATFFSDPGVRKSLKEGTFWQLMKARGFSRENVQPLLSAAMLSLAVASGVGAYRTPQESDGTGIPGEGALRIGDNPNPRAGSGAAASASGSLTKEELASQMSKFNAADNDALLQTHLNKAGLRHTVSLHEAINHLTRFNNYSLSHVINQIKKAEESVSSFMRLQKEQRTFQKFADSCLYSYYEPKARPGAYPSDYWKSRLRRFGGGIYREGLEVDKVAFEDLTFNDLMYIISTMGLHMTGR